MNTSITNTIFISYFKKIIKKTDSQKGFEYTVTSILNT